MWFFTGLHPDLEQRHHRPPFPEIKSPPYLFPHLHASSFTNACQHNACQTQPLHSSTTLLPCRGRHHAPGNHSFPTVLPADTISAHCPLLSWPRDRCPESASVPCTHSLLETSTFYLERTIPHVSPFVSHFPSGQGVYFYFISWNLPFEIINHLLAAIFLHPGMQKSHNTLEYFLTPTLNYAVAVL